MFKRIVELVVAVMPGARAQLIPDTAHNPQVTHPDSYALTSGTLGSVSTAAPLLAAISMQETLPILLLPLVGSAVFIALLICLRRFDAEEGSDGDERRGGGGELGPRPDRPVGPLAVVDPPLGEIRVSRAPASAKLPEEPRERETAIARASRTRA